MSEYVEMISKSIRYAKKTFCMMHKKFMDFLRKRFICKCVNKGPVSVFGTQKTSSTAIAALLASATLDIQSAIRDPACQL